MNCNSGMIKEVVVSESDLIRMSEKSKDIVQLAADTCEEVNDRVDSNPTRFDEPHVKASESDLIRMSEKSKDIVAADPCEEVNDRADSNTTRFDEPSLSKDSEVLLTQIKDLTIMTQKCAEDTCNEVNDLRQGDSTTTRTDEPNSSEDSAANRNKLAIVVKEKSPTISTKRGSFTCEICHQSFLRRANLNVHIKSKHGSSEPFPCKDCSKSFARKSYLISHIQVVHNPKYTYFS
ncbi:zinc finger protein 26-like [Trichogramma pretiosum]|uniref:zinc finger protein 26-like n=1 Tax=Trichogramma pretiosum TaxID=7493 RepID=UPI000C718F70|nr:zinc finger protein 26-like [Trichogramma pretiosum]